MQKTVKFRFQDLKIWQLAIEIADQLFYIADDLDKRKLFRFAEQLRAAGMRETNNKLSKYAQAITLIHFPFCALRHTLCAMLSFNALRYALCAMLNTE